MSRKVPMNKVELVLALKLMAVPIYLIALYVAGFVFQESYSVFDYGRF